MNISVPQVVEQLFVVLKRHAVRKARELELKYLRDFGVHEKVDEKEAVEK